MSAAVSTTEVGNWTLRLAAGLNGRSAQLKEVVSTAATHVSARVAPPPAPSHGRCTSLELLAMEGGVPAERQEEQSSVYSTLHSLGLNLNAAASSVEDAANRAASYLSQEPLLPTQDASGRCAAGSTSR